MNEIPVKKPVTPALKEIILLDMRKGQPEGCKLSGTAKQVFVLVTETFFVCWMKSKRVRKRV